jgi:hypothetical protein
MKLTVVESPLRGAVPASCPTWLAPLVERIERERNRHYAFECMRAELRCGRAPYASHVLFDQPGLLDDATPKERALGMDVGQAWSAVGHERIFFGDRGLSSGMRYGSTKAREIGQAQGNAMIAQYQPLSTWRCVLAVVLRWMLARCYR